MIRSRKLKELTGGKGADIVIEAVGHAEQQFNLCIELLGYAAEILYFGVVRRSSNGLPVARPDLQERVGSHQHQPRLPPRLPAGDAVDRRKAGRCESAGDSHVQVAEIQTAFETFRDRRERRDQCLRRVPGLSR